MLGKSSAQNYSRGIAKWLAKISLRQFTKKCTKENFQYIFGSIPYEIILSSIHVKFISEMYSLYDLLWLLTFVWLKLCMFISHTNHRVVSFPSSCFVLSFFRSPFRWNMYPPFKRPQSHSNNGGSDQDTSQGLTFSSKDTSSHKTYNFSEWDSNDFLIAVKRKTIWALILQHNHSLSVLSSFL